MGTVPSYDFGDGVDARERVLRMLLRRCFLGECPFSSSTDRISSSTDRTFSKSGPSSVGHNMRNMIYLI
jgi:hypothetical protein